MSRILHPRAWFHCQVCRPVAGRAATRRAARVTLARPGGGLNRLYQAVRLRALDFLSEV